MALFLAGSAVHCARKAWHVARDDVAETKKANNIELKPYIKIIDATLEPIDTLKNQIVADQYRAKLTVTFKNIGKTQARNFSPIAIDRCTFLVINPDGKGSTTYLLRGVDQGMDQEFKIVSPDEQFSLMRDMRIGKGTGQNDAKAPFFGNISSIPSGYQIIYTITGRFIFDDIRSLAEPDLGRREVHFQVDHKISGGQTPHAGKWGSIRARVTDDRYQNDPK